MIRISILTMLLIGLLASARAQSDVVKIKLVPVVSGLTSPVGMATPNDGSGRIFVFEQSGKVRIVKNGVLSEIPFLDVSSRLDGLNIAYSEKGLLGMAFHPDYKNNGRFFIYYSAPDKLPKFDHKSVIAEYKVSATDPNKADMAERVIMEILQPESNHNGGTMAFGPDGYLYIGTGDGGGANDEHGTVGNGQDLGTLLGKILRIDVDHEKPYAIPADNPFVNQDGHKPEIFAYGLRNPWKFSFDKVTGWLFCGDVGQNKYEEIDIIVKGGNYGWRILEGYNCFNPAVGCDQTGTKLPITEYDHDTGISVIGGHMYRGKNYPSLHGNYFFGDWNGKLFCIRRTSENVWKRIEVNVNDTGKNDIDGKINSMGEDDNGDVYVIGQRKMGPKSETGVLLKIVP